MEEFGTTKGLAYVHNWDAQANRTMSLFEADQKMAAQTKAEAEKLADDFTLGKVYTDRGRQKLGEFSNETFAKIGKFAAKNKNWQYDPVLRGQMKMLTNSLRDNSIVSAEETSELSRQQMAKDMANPDNGLDQEAFEPMKENLRNYQLTGNQTGKIDGTIEPFTYFAPKPFDANQKAQEILKLTETKTSFFSDGIYNYSTQTRSPEALHSAATNALAGPDGKRWQREFERGKAKGIIGDPDAHSMLLRMFKNYNGDVITKEINPFALENYKNQNNSNGDTEDAIVNVFDEHIKYPLLTDGIAHTQDMNKLFNTIYDKDKPTMVVNGYPRLKSVMTPGGKYNIIKGLEGRNVKVMYGNEIRKSRAYPGVYEAQVTMVVDRNALPSYYFQDEDKTKLKPEYTKDIRQSAREKDLNDNPLYEVDTYMDVPKFTAETQMRYNADYMEKKNNMKVAIANAAADVNRRRALSAAEQGTVFTNKKGEKYRFVINAFGDPETQYIK